MNIRIGYDISYECPQETAMVFMLSVHPSQRHELKIPDAICTSPHVLIGSYRDVFGNLCTRLIAPQGIFRLTADGVIANDGRPDRVVPEAGQMPVAKLPDEALTFLIGSRYCETDALSPIAWELFGNTPAGWSRVQAICEFVHGHITFGYCYASSTKTALEVYQEKQGVCRDFTHLAIAFCRCMNIPARYCTGYVSDIGMLPPYPPMDFAAWMEVYLEGGWYTFDPRNHVSRIGRILIARGRDAADVAISYSFGRTKLTNFTVRTEEHVGALRTEGSRSFQPYLESLQHSGT